MLQRTTNRRHLAFTLYAYLRNIPFIGISYHRKCRDFATFVGYDNKFLLSINQLLDDEVFLPKLKKLMQRSRTLPVFCEEKKFYDVVIEDKKFFCSKLAPGSMIKLRNLK